MLDAVLTEKVLSKLALTYGVRFNDVYAGMEPEMVRRNWAKELDGMSEDAIRYACNNLPERYPPNVLEFRRLCMSRRTEATRLALPAPRPQGMPPDVRAAIERLNRGNSRAMDQLAWARALRARELACEDLSHVQREMWRAALGGRADAQPQRPGLGFAVVGLVARNGEWSQIDPFGVIDVQEVKDETGAKRAGVARVRTLSDEWLIDGDPAAIRAMVSAVRRRRNEQPTSEATE